MRHCRRLQQRSRVLDLAGNVCTSRNRIAVVLCDAAQTVTAAPGLQKKIRAPESALVVVLSAVIANGQIVPAYKDYRGVTIGMSTDEVRGKLNRVKKGEHQDLLVFSEHESAQIYYDDKGKGSAISIDYIGDTSQAPTPITPKAFANSSPVVGA